jgi:hypothetical protein
MDRARTLVIEPTASQVLLVTGLHGAHLDQTPTNQICTLKLNPVAGSFQVLVVGKLTA